MTAQTPAIPKHLPVSILAGPSAGPILQDIVSQDASCRFGLLASSHDGAQPIHDSLLVGKLVAASAGGYDPVRIRAQISEIAEKALVDHLIIECDSKTHPVALASIFLPDGSAGNRFSEIARLNYIVVAIDSETLLRSLVRGTHASGVTSACILADQIECANVIVLIGDPVDHDFILARTVGLALNPSGRIVERSCEARPTELLEANESFDFEIAFAGAGWRQLMDEEPNIRRTGEGVTMFVYRARRPFHPAKFWDLIQNPFPDVFRAKGFFWLASRMGLVGGLNIAGLECHYSPAGQWWAANGHGSDSSHAEIPDRLKKEWTEPFGDRRQAIAFMGVDLNTAEVTARLDACLLGDSEMEAGENSWATLPDPFPAWSARTHDHECGEHDCCHH